MMEDKIQETLANLKDFQLKTVDYVFEQLYGLGRSKMLIADEVGLGKTIVAKGLIAKAFGNFKPSVVKPDFNVIYVCSNQALARQNLKKLNFTGDSRAVDYSADDDRITALAYQPAEAVSQTVFRIKAFTPATSFDDKTHAGKADERVLLYRLLYRSPDLTPHKESLKWVLKGNKRIWNENWETRIQEAEQFDRGYEVPRLRAIRKQIYQSFKIRLNDFVHPADLPKSFEKAGINYSIKYWALLKKLCQLDITADNHADFSFCKELIASLRFTLSRVCLEYLQADIFVLDEFQRYKRLIKKATPTANDQEKVSPAVLLARDIFSMKDAKVLMLSATPFKPYTNDFDELNGEVHYSEFIAVLKFLMTEQTEDFWKQYESDRKTLFKYLRHPDHLSDQLPEALKLKDQLEGIYRACMVRTEKLLASKDRDALIQQIDTTIPIQPEDVRDFVVLDQITQRLNQEHHTALPVPLEYVKSSPFALSFLDNYQHKEKLRNLLTSDAELQKLMQHSKHAWVNLKDINQYKPLVPLRAKSIPNAKLRFLLERTVQKQGWKYLWIPPSIPYYKLEGAFKDSWGYSKTLIFSSWKMVPRMVSTLVSYEAERLAISSHLQTLTEKEKNDKEQNQHYYFLPRRTPRPQFTFKAPKEEKEPRQMNHFMLSYPCLFLAKFYDPAENVLEKLSLRQLKTKLKNQLIAKFQELNLHQYASEGSDWKKWFWLAPLLLDKASDHQLTMKVWLNQGVPPSELSIDAEDTQSNEDEFTGKERHFNYAKIIFNATGSLKVPPLNEEQLEYVCGHLAELTLGAPAICYLRSQLRHLALDQELLSAAFNVASAFLTMFNKPESIAIVRAHTRDNDYAVRALQYLIDGNVQAMLDEFLYLLIRGENIQSAAELSDYISDILSMRTANTEVEDYLTFRDRVNGKTVRKKSIRCHYALDFGTQKISTAKGANRLINMRQAFNSPFRPFVLASTSIGQEGLDFHLYCKRIVHWNLPSNPIDFEQREGRIHRYQGLVIRLNLADKYRELIQHSAGHDVWKALFDLAQQEKALATFPCDLVPFWHTETQNDIKIERLVPLYPFSKDHDKLKNLIKVLTFYRLTFGQPRQSELVDALHESGFSDEEIKKLDDLMINLSPITF